MSKNYRLQDLAEWIQAELVGDPDYRVCGLAPLENAHHSHLSFLANPRFARHLADTKAGAVLMQRAFAQDFAGYKLLIDDPYYGYACLSKLFDNRPTMAVGIHPMAYCHPGAKIDPTVRVGPHVVVGRDCAIGAHSEIAAGCVLEPGCRLGEQVCLAPQVTLRHGVILGNRVRVDSNTVIGSDGFGFAGHKGAWHRICQLGTVVVGDDADIGAGTTIDRGAIGNTVIGKGVVIDNQVQIAHNVSLGDYTGIAGCVGIAGSTKIGKHCTIAGDVGIAGHLRIGDGVHISGGSIVTKSLPRAGSYSSGAGGCIETRKWRRQVVRMRQLDALVARVSKLEAVLLRGEGVR